MTLSPIFRSPEAVEALRSKGYLDSLGDSIEAQRKAVRRLGELLGDVLAPEYLRKAEEAPDEVTFVQEDFFLILFHSLFRSLGCPEERLGAYALLNLCIKGLVTSGDNLFDGEAKITLPLRLGKGARFASIMQMLSFDHLIARILEEEAGFFSAEQRVEFRRDLLSRMAFIGTLEGSEEGGVDEVPSVQAMVEKVHRVRGGALFALAFSAPLIGEPRGQRCIWEQAEAGVRHLGTAFQIVDDVTDFEFDLGRRSHNLVVAQIVHGGSPAERQALARVRASRSAPKAGVLEKHFRGSAAAALELAGEEAVKGFRLWQELGFWFPPEDSGLFVRAIAGDSGDQRVAAVARESGRV